MRIKFSRGFIILFSGIWIAFSVFLEIGHHGGDMQGLGFYLGGLPFTKIDFIYSIWRGHYFSRIVLLIFNSLFWGLCIDAFYLAVKILWRICKRRKLK